jgi:hypothetical protein
VSDSRLRPQPRFIPNANDRVQSMGSIYAFDVITRSGSPFLTGKRLFARALIGTPKGIICDSMGNVFAGCGDGVEIWNPGGTLLGVIRVPGESQKWLKLAEMNTNEYQSACGEPGVGNTRGVVHLC